MIRKVGPLLLLFLPSLIWPAKGQQLLDCPPCNALTCYSGYTENSCPEGTFWVQNITLCGCCPGCVQYLDEGAECQLSAATNPTLKWGEPGPNGVTPILINQCNPTTKCSNNSGSQFICTMAAVDTSCWNKLKLYQEKKLNWKPVCEADGSFAPKQCKGTMDTGRCYCFDKDGNRIFGMDWQTNTDKMNCACSRRVSELRKKSITDSLHVTSLHCDSNGNYEPLQCDGGRCFCMNTTTGDVIGTLVPQDNWKSLPCYSSEENGEEYFRLCDSQYFAQASMEKELTLHGMTFDGISKVQCGYDGSYDPVSCKNDQCFCVKKDGSLSQYHVATTSANEMNCYCYQDAQFFLESKVTSLLTCQPNGNYNPLQYIGSKVYCVDKDGYPTTDLYDDYYACCLNSDNGCVDKRCSDFSFTVCSDLYDRYD